MFPEDFFVRIGRPYKEVFTCWPLAMHPGMKREDLEYGGKILLPPSALRMLTLLDIDFPMLFKLINKNQNRETHCGVLEFVAEEGKIFIPSWMMEHMLITDGKPVVVESVSLPLATYSKFQPQSVDFLEIFNPKALLENCLRNFTCLTVGDIIAINYNGKIYKVSVLETKPRKAVKIIECDMNVDFAAPVGLQEPTPGKQVTPEKMIDPASLMPEPTGFVAFKGSGSRLDGKNTKHETTDEPSKTKAVYQRGIPDYDYKVGTVQFFRNIGPATTEKEGENPREFKAFSGFGSKLKTSSKKKE